MKHLLLQISIIMALSLVPAVAVNDYAYAACADSSTSKGQVIAGIKETGGDCSGQGVYDVLAAVTKILGIIAGAVAVIAIIWAGFKYITSGGDPAKVGQAKNTLIYAVVGLAVAVLAQLIVNVVITQADKTGSSTSTTKPKP